MKVPTTIFYDGANREVNILDYLPSKTKQHDPDAEESKRESLILIDDGVFLLRIEKRTKPNYCDVNEKLRFMTAEYKIETEPIKWLLENGWTGVANQMTKENQKENISDIKLKEKVERKYRGETLCGSGDTKGEAE